ncbi:MAG: radical SAM protein [Firmicutes bacterium]|nr:radical SAM protein [Bacillota bacterium]
MKNKKALTLAVDMYGCPNRCLHCWLSHMPNRAMEPNADEWIADLFKPYFDEIEFFSWLREPDFCPDYRGRWERDKMLSANAVPPRFELASFWRIVRDPEYAGFLKEVGVNCVQLTFFGMEATTDRYVGRKGAFSELLKATEILLDHDISPRWQTFINEENKDELPALLQLSKDLELAKRCEAFGGVFRFFVHPGSCDGENRKLYPIRIIKEHIPEELIPYFLNYDELYPEKQWYEMWKDDTSHVVPHNSEGIVLYVTNNYDLFFNFTHMRPEWRIGNLKTDLIDELIRRVVEEDIPALREARSITLGELVRRYADPFSEKAFEEEDLRMYLLNTHLERMEE